MNKRKKSALNMASSLTYKVLTMVLGIIIPHLFITSYGSEINGLQSSVGQIFTYLALLEAGIGGATIQSMYAPVATDDTKKINSYLSATSKYYNKIGIIYFVIMTLAGLIYSLVIPVESMPWWQVFVYVLLSGFMGGINYFYLAKLKLLISAKGDSYLVNVMLTVTYVLNSTAKILLILLGANILLLQAVNIIINAAITLVYYIIAKRIYPWLSFREEPDFSCTEQKNSVMVHKIAGLLFQNVDVLLLTFMCDLNTVSIYTMYKLVVNMVNTVVATFGDSVNFVFGQKMNAGDTEHKEYKGLIDAFNVYYSAISMGLFSVMYLLLIPFMRLYTADMDINYVYELLPWLYISIEILTVGREASMRTIEVAGHFKKTQWRAVAETGINVVASVAAILVCKHFYGAVGGLYGALIGTIVAMLYRTIDMNVYANKRILGRGAMKSFWIMLTNTVLFVAIALLVRPLVPQIDNYVEFILHGAWITVLILALFVVVQSIMNPKQFKYVLSFIRSRK